MNRTFYWIKLKTDFFRREEIDFLLSQKNGAEYVVLYQMICLNTANSDGKLETKIGEMIVPYNAEKIARDCKYFDVDTVNIAMNLYKKLGLIYEEQEGGLKIAAFDEMVGKESKWAEKKRIYRKNQSQLLLKEDTKEDIVQNINEDIVQNVSVDIDEDIVRQEYRDKSIEYRDIDNRDILSVSVSEDSLKTFQQLFKDFQIEKIDDQKLILKYLKNGMSLEVIKNGLTIPFNRNATNYDFEKQKAPIENPISYGMQILANWNDFGVQNMEDVKKYNKIKGGAKL
nr:MAG TPA: Replication initiation and membrane attachment [Caudoviricetes sp.]